MIGGVLGNQFGGGDGKKLATVGGALAGGYAGNKIQENNQENDLQKRSWSADGLTTPKLKSPSGPLQQRESARHRRSGSIRDWSISRDSSLSMENELDYVRSVRAR